jgi:hypothetical protein
LFASSTFKEELLQYGIDARHIALDDGLPFSIPLELMRPRTTEITASISVGGEEEINTAPLRLLFLSLNEASTAPNLRIIRIQWPHSWNYQSFWKAIPTMALDSTIYADLYGLCVAASMILRPRGIRILDEESNELEVVNNPIA